MTTPRAPRTPTALDRSIAAVIRERMEDRHVSVSELTRRTESDRANLTAKLNGRRRFDVRDLWSISTALDWSPATLTREVDQHMKTEVESE